MQVQIKILFTEVDKGGGIQGANTEVARSQMFDGSSRKVLDFVLVCKLYIRIKIRGIIVKEQKQ